MQTLRLLVGIVAVLAPVLPCHAQATGEHDAARSLTVAPPNLGFAGTFGAGRDEGSRTAAQVVLEAAIKDKTGTAALSKKTGSFHFGLKLSGAIDDSGEAVPLALDGLSSGARVAFDFSRWNWRGPTLSEQRAYGALCRSDAAQCECALSDFARPEDRAAAEQLLASTPPSRENLDEFEVICRKWTGHAPCSVVDLLDSQARSRAEELLKGNSEVAREKYQALCREKAATCHCDDADFADPAVRAEAQRLLRADSKPTFIGGGLEVGRTRFKYLDPLLLTSQAANHNDWVASGRAGIFLAPLGFLLATYSYEKSFSPAGPANSICTPLASSIPGSTSCRNATLGPPTSSSGSIVGVELRRISAGGIGIAPSVQRHIDDKVTGVQLPIYFISSADKGLMGGVRLGWRSDQKTASVSVFVGSTFSLVP